MISLRLLRYWVAQSLDITENNAPKISYWLFFELRVCSHHESWDFYWKVRLVLQLRDKYCHSATARLPINELQHMLAPKMFWILALQLTSSVDETTWPNFSEVAFRERFPRGTNFRMIKMSGAKVTLAKSKEIRRSYHCGDQWLKISGRYRKSVVSRRCQKRSACK